MQIPHGNARINQKSYIRASRSDVKRRSGAMKTECGVLTDGASTSGSIVLQDREFEIDSEVGNFTIFFGHLVLAFTSEKYCLCSAFHLDENERKRGNAHFTMHWCFRSFIVQLNVKDFTVDS